MATDARPNIVFVRCDNVGWGDFSCYKSIEKPIVSPQFPMIFDLGSDPGERNPLFADKMDCGWMFECAVPIVLEYQKSVAQYPNIKPGQEFTGYPKAKSAP